MTPHSLSVSYMNLRGLLIEIDPFFYRQIETHPMTLHNPPKYE